VAEAMVAFVLADATIEKFGGDSMTELLANWQAYRARTSARFQR
jgi:chorismate synthase